MKVIPEPSLTGGQSRGFTLVELLVSMVIVMIILAGLYSNVLMQSRVQANQASTVDSVEDLRLASQIMAPQLRLSANLCWDNANNRLIYQPLGATAMTAAACTAGTLNYDWGAFQFSSGTLCWDVPNKWAASPNGLNYGCQQVLRGLNTATGFQVAPTSNTSLTVMRSLKLVSQYQSVDRQNKDLEIDFDVLPRNN
jgi:prepilin-type N-terminal cleavage/methylation domain-containing protein